jgi:hypothetical protein
LVKTLAFWEGPVTGTSRLSWEAPMIAVGAAVVKGC